MDFGGSNEKDDDDDDETNEEERKRTMMTTRPSASIYYRLHLSCLLEETIKKVGCGRRTIVIKIDVYKPATTTSTPVPTINFASKIYNTGNRNPNISYIMGVHISDISS